MTVNEFLKKHVFLFAASLCAAATALFYRAALESAEWALKYVMEYGAESIAVRFLWFVTLCVLSRQVWRIVVWNNELAGGGLAHMLAVYDRGISLSWLKNIFGNLAGGTITLLSGLSIGNESPVVQIGASAAAGVAETHKGARKYLRNLMEAGSAAGFAVGFSAPVTALLFARWLTNGRRGLSFYMPLVLMLGAVYGIIVFVYGVGPYFDFRAVRVSNILEASFFAPLLGIFCGLCGVTFSRLMLVIQRAFDKFNGGSSPRFVLIWCVFMISGITVFLFPSASGSGAYLVNDLAMSDGGFPMRFLAAAFVIKFLFTLICPTSGVPGGMMYPVLTLGALTGVIFSACVCDAGYSFIFLLCGMGGMFCAVFRMPFVAMALVIEMTWRFDCVLPVLLTVLFAYITMRICSADGLYELLEARIIKRESEMKSEE